MKYYYSLGLMSGTSGDGVDASIIQSDGVNTYKVILNKYFQYDKYIYENIHWLISLIKDSSDLKRFSKDVKKLEKIITLFHAKVVKEIIKESKININLIGFHGQTILHYLGSRGSDEKISKQLGNGKLLAKLTKKKVVYNFRQKDLKNNGNGAPLAPIFHKLLVNQNNIYEPVIILNIGGIANMTAIGKPWGGLARIGMASRDIGPGNCLIDHWMRKYHDKYDKDGLIARSGKIIKSRLNKEIKIEKRRQWNRRLRSISSLDIKDYITTYLDTVFTEGLSLRDGAATLTEFTVLTLSSWINTYCKEMDYYNSGKKTKVIVCGGGRKNKFLLKSISKKIKHKLVLIDKYGIDGDFVESQAFAYLAIRSYLKLPISFPSTTGVSKPCTGGVIVKN